MEKNKDVISIVHQQNSMIDTLITMLRKKINRQSAKLAVTTLLATIATINLYMRIRIIEEEIRGMKEKE